MQIRPADRRCSYPHQYVARSNRGSRRRLNRQSSRRLHFPQRLHRASFNSRPAISRYTLSCNNAATAQFADVSTRAKQLQPAPQSRQTFTLPPIRLPAPSPVANPISLYLGMASPQCDETDPRPAPTAPANPFPQIASAHLSTHLPATYAAQSISRLCVHPVPP